VRGCQLFEEGLDVRGEPVDQEIPRASSSLRQAADHVIREHVGIVLAPKIVGLPEQALVD
jgi:hypothetical protein